MSDPDLSAFLISQDWSAYTAQDHAVWRTLYTRRLAHLERTASRLFLEGIRTIGLAPDRVPDLAEVNARLEARTGWQATPVSGFLPARAFFACLAARRFPTTVTIRPPEQLEYVPEPDIFHDVFGHVPLHADPVFAAFLREFGTLAAAADDDALVGLTRLFWFTVEFGLVREGSEVRVYGSGLISSAADAANALSERCDRWPFALDRVLAQPFQIDGLQDVLFVVDSFDTLFEAVKRLARG